MKAELENLKHMDILDDEVSVTSSYIENNESDMDAFSLKTEGLLQIPKNFMSILLQNHLKINALVYLKMY